MNNSNTEIFFGTDHRGYKLASELYLWLLGENAPVTNLGAENLDSEDDYVGYALKVAEKVASETGTKGIVFCGSGVGVSIVANKVKGIRCGLGINEEQVNASRRDDDINVLAIAADETSEEDAKKMIKVFLETEFSNEERHVRRLQKIADYEAK